MALKTDTNFLDVLIVGAGFSGLYLLHRLRCNGFDVQIVEAAPEVGGTWYHNRYPGLRCDVESLEYQYSWSHELRSKWRWSERYAKQSEILAYAKWVADTLELRDDILLNTRIRQAKWQEDKKKWLAITDSDAEVSARHIVFATGALTVPRMPSISGINKFHGDLLHSAAWPEQPVDFQGKRVGLVGTGSSGVQIATAIASEAGTLQIFQRSPAYSLPARNRPLSDSDYENFLSHLEEFDALAMRHRGGVVCPLPENGVLGVTQEEREKHLFQRWQHGGAFAFTSSFNDIQTSETANAPVAEFLRARIREAVKDPDIAEKLCPDYFYGTRRTCVDTGYYEIFNQNHVQLVDVSQNAITEVTENGLRLESGEEFDLDILIMATGYDALTGGFLAVDVTGRDGLTNQEAWADGPATLLGLMISGFPNLFMMAGPGSPSVLTNVIRSIEYHVDWLTRCFEDLRAAGLAVIEPSEEAQADWVSHVNDVASKTLFTKTPSWYCGSDIPGKPKLFMPYAGGLPAYREKAEEAALHGYRGFRRGK